MEQCIAIHEFPDYSVSDWGRVRNVNTGRVLVQVRNNQGVVNVGMMRGGIQQRRSVALLVARHFLDPHPSSRFNTPIHLDGERMNNRADNLLWRPRWFAIKYGQQFENDQRGFRVPVVDMDSGEEFPTSWEAATKFGLIDRDIWISAMNNTPVWPTYQRIREIV